VSERAGALRVLTMNTFAFMVCFAAWVMNGVLVTFLVDHRVYPWDQAQMGLLIGAPVLSGALMRLPMGILTDRFGGRLVFTLLMFVSAVPLYLVGAADRYIQFLLASVGFGLCGASFAVGIAYTSIWFRKEHQGTVLGVFGMGNAGAALTSMGAPVILRKITHEAAYLEGWRTLPRIYAALLVVTGIVFWLLTISKKADQAQAPTLRQRLAPLKYVRVWRFGLYYFFFFGSFVALSQWLIPYYVNAYTLSIGTAGLVAALFSLPAGLTRTFGGWLSDKWGARTVMYGTLGFSLILLILLFPPRMEVQSPGQGVIAERPGTVASVSSDKIVVGSEQYRLARPVEQHDVRVRLGIQGTDTSQGVIFFPTASFWQEPAVQVGDTVGKGQLLARGITRVYFQANVWVFTSLALLVGITMGMGSAAVYKHVATYYPTSVGLVGGLVGVIGGLGGFVNPLLFGYLLRATGIWTTCWMFLALVSLVCLVWMHLVVRRMMRRQAPDLARHIEAAPS
jgi:MFS transporter, NNP family, nitrate/nitrite transporter